MNIVVTGIGLVTAMGIGVEHNIVSIREGRSGISSVPALLKTSNLLPVGELRVTNEELHDIAGVSRKEHLSRTALLGVIAVKEALADAGIDRTRRIGMVSSTSVGGMDLSEHFFEDFIEDDTKGRLRDVRMHDCSTTTEVIARHCGINGYTTTISTACSSAANAIIAGAKLLRHNIIDTVVVGGTDALSAFTLNGFKSLMILDERQCRPFDANRAGLNLGEGAGYLVMENYQQSTVSGQQAYCRLAGYANSNDAHHQTASSVEGNGAYLAMEEALRVAGLAPEAVSYVNAHGTGTGNNDASESAAFKRLFGDKMPRFSSTKSFTGHTLAAAGGIEAVLSVLAIRYGYIYPNLNFENPIEEYGLRPVTRFEENTDVNCVLTNSFGFGGNCSSLVFAR